MATEREIQLVEAALKAAAELVDVGTGSAGEFYAKQIRSLDPAAIVASVPKSQAAQSELALIALRKAEQFADVARDWNMEEVQIDGEMVGTYELREEFKAAIAALSAQEQVDRNSAGETPTEHAHRWATELAILMARKHYPDAPQWKPLPDLLGVITQIDNMASGLVRAPQEQVEPTDAEILARWSEITSRYDSLVPEVICKFARALLSANQGK